VVTSVRLDRGPWSDARWLVVAPHPDDETIGAGALISHAARRGRLAAVCYLTDGRGSHPAKTPRIASARKAEARCALARLAGGEVDIRWIGWSDAHPHEEGDLRFERDAQALGSILRELRVDAVAVTDFDEAHCDHVAAFRLAKAAIRSARRSVGLFAYRVWSSDAGRPGARIRTDNMAPGLRRRALSAHRSQLSPAFGDGFRIPAEIRRMPPFDLLTNRSRVR
jgi:N-acetylglucosamine malate deacetylase 1